MAAISARDKVEVVLDAIDESGGSGGYLSDRLSAHPRKFGVEYLGESFEVWIYLWTLTHGGGSVRAENEYRIQLTTVDPPLDLNPEGPTLLMGYYPDLGVFAGFDVQAHVQFTAGSPSIQISLETLDAALQNGISFYERANEETAVAVKPGQFLEYALHAGELHREGPGAEELLERVARGDEDADSDLIAQAPEREQIVREVSRLSRDASFRGRVMSAYGNRCAVTRRQLKLVDAAHILPVAGKGSDSTSNGLALSPTFHRAFDNGLVYLDEASLSMELNQGKADRLENTDFADGLDGFKDWLGRRIHLPLEGRLRPNAGLIERANAYRQIPGY